MGEFDSWYGPVGLGSGVGSGAKYTTGYRTFLERFMNDHNIRSVLDVGCGDWQFSRLVFWGHLLYVGVDEVRELVERLNKEYGGTLRRFATELPWWQFDLVICKDVMIHLPNVEVQALIAELRCRGRHLLLVNDFAPAPNADCERGDYRAFDINAEPFNLGAEIVYTFPRLNHETKVVHHKCST